MEFAIIFIWLACMLTFSATKHQKLNNRQLSKTVVWAAFTFLVSASWYLMTFEYAFVTAGLLVLSLIMLMWILIIFSHGHSKLKLLPFTAIGGVFFVGLAQLGGL